MSIKKPLYYEYQLEKTASYDLLAVVHIDDRNNDSIELHVTQGGEAINLENTTVTARFVSRRNNILINDNVSCAINESGNIIIPFDRPRVETIKGDMRIEINIAESDGEITFQFPLWVRINGSILDGAEIAPQSRGTIPELLEDARAELARVSEFTNGKSAYEIAVDNGYVGTEEQWLASLVGATGAAGPQGEQGIQGFSIVDVSINNQGELVVWLEVGYDEDEEERDVQRMILGRVAGAKGDKGEKGDPGTAGADGSDYVLTAADKAEIASTAAGLVTVPESTSDLTNDSGFMPMIDVNSLSSCTENGVLYRVKEINDTYLILNNKPEAVMGAVWTQFRFRDDGIAYRISEYSNGDWGAFDSFGFFEDCINKASSITDDNKTSIADYPTIKAVVDYIAAQGFLTSHQDISGKYEKPSGGIPKTDLSSAVQTSLGKADSALQSYTEQYTGTITGITMNGSSKGTSGVVDLGTVITAHQDISGKENTSNKVTSLSSNSTDSQYPSAKCVYDMIGNIETLLSQV